ncbi:hypothetical protein [Mesorhizobium sp.]|uniref:hypothetical protein n=1 Tax=Mesorhizobium sp. TaxID=1871066 RepID=UPI000FEA9CC5|nr:hypothetical protein [Mesorhizobium sp.]RWP51092.1 MAG: hypothetical protein EOR05_04010 [Mesorhizobium sp.]
MSKEEQRRQRSCAGLMQGVAEAKQAGAEIKDALSVTARPTVEPTSIHAAPANTFGLLHQIGAAASAADAKVDAQIRRAHTDFGVAP